MAKVFKRSGSPRYYGQLVTADGKRKQVPLSVDHRASVGLLRRLQTEQDQLRALGLDDRSKARKEPLNVHIDAYRDHLQSKGGTPKHIALTVGRLERVLRGIKADRISDITSGKVANLLERWRREGMPATMETRKGRTPAPLAVLSSNHYVRSLRAFSRWLWTTEVTDSDILRGLRPLNARTDRRHVRRALSADELSLLVSSTHSRGETVVGKNWTLTGEDRSMLYSVAAFTGLRASELRSLTPESVDLLHCVLQVSAKNSKHRKDDVLPLHGSLIAVLRGWLAGKEPGQPLWPGRWSTMGASILRRDLALAGILYKDAAGAIFDFHALRGQFITSLARAGVSPSLAMKLARHSDVNLTMTHYTHLGDDTLRAALSTVPGLSD